MGNKKTWATALKKKTKSRILVEENWKTSGRQPPGVLKTAGKKEKQAPNARKDVREPISNAKWQEQNPIFAGKTTVKKGGKKRKETGNPKTGESTPGTSTAPQKRKETGALCEFWGAKRVLGVPRKKK